MPSRSSRSDHRPFDLVHQKCQQGPQCKGPGCKAETGKTRREPPREVRAARQRSAQQERVAAQSAVRKAKEAK